MLTAYFDDSGTHDPSEVVLLAGLLGTENQFAGLDDGWKVRLAAPICGRKDRIKNFHMTECQASRGEFKGWSRTETDYFCDLLAQEIIRSGVTGYACACSRRDSDELVKGDTRDILGDPEGQCVRNVFVKAVEWAKDITTDPQMAFVFDNRPHRQAENQLIFDLYQRYVQIENSRPELYSISFVSAKTLVPLQAADLVAWEVYQHARDILEHGLIKPRRRQYIELASGIKLDAQIVLRRSIRKMVSIVRWMPIAERRLMAQRFRNFEPDALMLSPGQSS